MKLVSESRSFGGSQRTYTHRSEVCDCDMRFAVYLPPQADKGQVPVVWWLSGLTCTEENFSVKSGAQRYASELGLALIIPDTSPRGEDIPDDESWDLGTGAGFYVNATQQPWATNYRMYDYVNEELPTLVNKHLPIDPERVGISGHSMGGHGALTIALKNPKRFRSVSAFSPICAPTQCAWGEKALSTYLGDDREAWNEYDACELIRRQPLEVPLLVDQGADDDFLEGQLKPSLLEQACADSGQKLQLRIQTGYDHSYFFVSSFIGEHLRHHQPA